MYAASIDLLFNDELTGGNSGFMWRPCPGSGAGKRGRAGVKQWTITWSGGDFHDWGHASSPQPRHAERLAARTPRAVGRTHPVRRPLLRRSEERRVGKGWRPRRWAEAE